MGLHSPFDYSGYEPAFLELFLHLIDNFCGSCHTNNDFEVGCKGCPIGQLVYVSKVYLLDACESDILIEECKIIRKIKKAITPIRPSPLMLATWIWQEKRNPDPLLVLRVCLKELRFQHSTRLLVFEVREKIQAQMARVMLEAGKLKQIKCNSCGKSELKSNGKKRRGALRESVKKLDKIGKAIEDKKRKRRLKA